MSTQTSLASSFDVTVKTMYVPEQSKPEERFYFFAYRITIKNRGQVPAQLMTRHWVITDGLGHTEEVRGPGVIGQQPRIQPGAEFEYESACPLTTSHGTMKGSYDLIADGGDKFSVPIPEFDLISPCALH